MPLCVTTGLLTVYGGIMITKICVITQKFVIIILEGRMEIRRDSYLKKLTDRMENGLVKIITSIRRCSKT